MKIWREMRHLCARCGMLLVIGQYTTCNLHCWQYLHVQAEGENTKRQPNVEAAKSTPRSSVGASHPSTGRHLSQVEIPHQFSSILSILSRRHRAPRLQPRGGRHILAEKSRPHPSHWQRVSSRGHSSARLYRECAADPLHCNFTVNLGDVSAHTSQESIV